VGAQRFNSCPYPQMALQYLNVRIADNSGVAKHKPENEIFKFTGVSNKPNWIYPSS
jgi:hypothetical protein